MIVAESYHWQSGIKVTLTTSHISQKLISFTSPVPNNFQPILFINLFQPFTVLLSHCLVCLPCHISTQPTFWAGLMHLDYHLRLPLHSSTITALRFLLKLNARYIHIFLFVPSPLQDSGASTLREHHWKDDTVPYLSQFFTRASQWSLFCPSPWSYCFCHLGGNHSEAPFPGFFLHIEGKRSSRILIDLGFSVAPSRVFCRCLPAPKTSCSFSNLDFGRWISVRTLLSKRSCAA